jgi:3-oxoacyl-[acyl-carrier protein] reductase
MTESKRVVVVTGGNSGIGKAIAHAFARDSHVVIIGRNEATLRRTADELGPDAWWIRADVARREEVARAVDAVVAKHTNIHVLVNNAGFINATTTDMSLEEAEEAWDEMVDTVLKGSFLMAVAVAKHLVRPGGRIINVSSIAALTGGRRPGAAGYAAAKAGLHGLTYGLARELSPQGITVNAVAPGFIANTGFTGHWPQEAIRSIVAQTPAGRPGTAQDVAAAVYFLASPETSFITGEVLNVNGGWVFGRG